MPYSSAVAKSFLTSGGAGLANLGTVTCETGFLASAVSERRERMAVTELGSVAVVFGAYRSGAAIFLYNLLVMHHS